jgi:hypothetical protein
LWRETSEITSNLFIILKSVPGFFCLFSVPMSFLSSLLTIKVDAKQQNTTNKLNKLKNYCCEEQKIKELL